MRIELDMNYDSDRVKHWRVDAQWNDPRDALKSLKRSGFGDSANEAAAAAIQLLMLAIACDDPK